MQRTHKPNKRSGVDAGTALSLHMLRCWPGATHRERWALEVQRGEHDEQRTGGT